MSLAGAMYSLLATGVAEAGLILWLFIVAAFFGDLVGRQAGTW